MTEWHPEVVRIERVENHPNADRLSIVTVNGNYPCIVKRDEFREGDLAAYVPVDTVVPDNGLFAFLAPEKHEIGSVPEKYRTIRAKKLRGIFSMGLMFPAPEGLSLGDSVVDYFGLKKWEEEEEDLAPNQRQTQSNPKRKPIGWDVPYYDIESLRKYYNSLAELDHEVVITEKLHGCNACFTFDGKQLWVKSRNLYKKSNAEKERDANARLPEGHEPLKIVGSEDYWWEAAINYDIDDAIRIWPMMSFFGEVYGQVKHFPYDRGNGPPRVRFFDIYDHQRERFMDYDDFRSVCEACHLPVAPLLYTGKLPSFEDVKSMASGLSTLTPHVREGVVVRTRQEALCGQFRAQFKLVSEDYLLKK